MPRSRSHAKPITDAVRDLVSAVTALVTTVQGAAASSPAGRTSARQAGKDGREVSAAAKAKSQKLRRSLKAYWRTMKGKAREQRVAVMLRGRGLRPKGR